MTKDRSNETETEQKERLASILANAFNKAGLGGPIILDPEAVSKWDDFNEHMDADIDILYENDRIVAFRVYNYDGEWFSVVDTKNEEFVLTSTTSDFVMTSEDDSLMMYKH